MGVYNPNKPNVLGQEWVPVRDESIVLNQLLNTVEYGQRFMTSSALTITDGRFYVNAFAEQLVRQQVMTMAIYPAGMEARSGPIDSVIIPCNTISGGISGANVTLVNASGGLEQAVYDPSDRRYVRIAMGNGIQGDVFMGFAIPQYANLLTGKRILGVNFLYAAEELIPAGDDAGQNCSVDMYLRSSGGPDVFKYPAIFSGTQPIQSPVSPFQPGVINRIALGDTNGFLTPFNGVDILTCAPWVYSYLARFDPSDPNPIQVHLDSTALAGDGAVISLDYAALEVVYCDEQRVAFGSTPYGSNNLNSQYVMGANIILMRDLAYSPNPVLAANTNYTLTLSESNFGDSVLAYTVNRVGPQPKLNALRQLYEMPQDIGIQVNKPGPPTPNINGQVFTAEETDVLLQLSLHTSAGTVDVTHSYGRQSKAKVYDATNHRAVQAIDDRGVAPLSYTQVRLYARRFGKTVNPLYVSTTLGPAQASITPVDFDQLPEIVDGWKEVTLRLTQPIVMGGTGNPNWHLTEPTADVEGNHWEVLGAIAPAASGDPLVPNLVAQVGTPNTLRVTTYGQPVSGGMIFESWMPQGVQAPAVTAVANDPSADMVLLFSTDAPAPSGFGVVQVSQPLSGIGQNCGLNPAFIPTALTYNQLSWNLDYSTQVYDTFSRTSVNTWGTASDGQSWGSAGGVATDFQVNNGVGKVTLSTTNSYRNMTLGAAGQVLQNLTGYVEISSDTAASGADHWGALTLRNNTTANQLYAQVNFATDGTYKLILSTVTASVHTALGTAVLGRYTVGTKVKVRVLLVGSLFKGKAWLDGTTEPADWTLEVATNDNAAAGQVGNRNIAGSGSPTGITISYDNLLVGDLTMGYTELQRMDTVDTTWQTIATSSAATLPTFNDYEARIGILTSYRIRNGNVRGFYGPWSSTITTTIPSPGLTAVAVTSADHILAFTTNADQTGARNLAYAMAWEAGNVVEENFNFPESAGQVIQTMYGKDFVTVFRTTERGGVNFTRTLLVQAAAIAPETLEDFESLRDMAWADVPYICLRDEDGNRWFANISVPTGSVQRDRRLYMASINVIEVTDTAVPVARP